MMLCPSSLGGPTARGSCQTEKSRDGSRIEAGLLKHRNPLIGTQGAVQHEDADRKDHSSNYERAPRQHTNFAFLLGHTRYQSRIERCVLIHG